MNTKSNSTLNALNETKDLWNTMTFGSLVHSLRISDKISQVVLAKKLGISKQFLSDVEHNRKDVGISFAKKIAEALDYSIEPLIELLIRDQLRRQHLNYIVELKKVTWATRQELVEAAWIVIVSSALLGVFIASMDLIVSRLLALVIR